MNLPLLVMERVRALTLFHDHCVDFVEQRRFEGHLVFDEFQEGDVACSQGVSIGDQWTAGPSGTGVELSHPT